MIGIVDSNIKRKPLTISAHMMPAIPIAYVDIARRHFDLASVAETFAAGPVVLFHDGCWEGREVVVCVWEAVLRGCGAVVCCEKV